MVYKKIERAKQMKQVSMMYRYVISSVIMSWIVMCAMITSRVIQNQTDLVMQTLIFVIAVLVLALLCGIAIAIINPCIEKKHE